MIWSKLFCVYRAISNLKALEGRIKTLRVGALGGLDLFNLRGSSWPNLSDR